MVLVLKEVASYNTALWQQAGTSWSSKSEMRGKGRGAELKKKK